MSPMSPKSTRVGSDIQSTVNYTSQVVVHNEAVYGSEPEADILVSTSTGVIL